MLNSSLNGEIMSDSQEELLNKIAHMESHAKANNIEVVLLKASLADVLSRLSVVEAEVSNVKIEVENNRKNSHPSVAAQKTKKNLEIETNKIKFRPKSGIFSPSNGSSVPPRRVSGHETFPTLVQKNAFGDYKIHSNVRRTQSVKKISSSEKNATASDATEDGKPKLILAKRPSYSKKRLSSLSGGSSDDASPKEDNVKFYMRGRSISIYTPTDYHEANYDSNAPDEKLQLNWVYGYRGKDCRDNLFRLASGELIYNMAGVVILYNDEKRTQRHYTDHSDDSFQDEIEKYLEIFFRPENTHAYHCLAVHPNNEFIASGQVAGHSEGDEGKPHVLVWNSTTLETLCSFGHGDFERAVCAVGFSPAENGRYLAVIDESNDHVLYIWDWEKKIKLSETKCSKEIVFTIKWNPITPLSFITYGKSHLAFWEFHYDSNQSYLTKKMGIYEKVGKPKYVLAASFTSSGDVVTGDSNGNILLFKNGSNKISSASASTQKGGVFAICVLEDDKILSSGKDGQLSLWDTNLTKLKDLEQLNECYGTARCILWDAKDESFLVGTSKNCIIHYGSDWSTEAVLMQGHSDEMWGLATHPSKTFFATCSQEQLVCVWDSKTQNNNWVYYIEEKAQCCSFHPTQSYVLVGTTSGTIYVLNYETKEELITLPIARVQLDDLKFSPDGKYFATASRDMNIYMYQWPDDITNFKKPKTLQGHSSRVLHLDWSLGSEYLQSSSSDYEILYWHIESGCQILSTAALRDVVWATWTCPLGFPVMGIWPEGVDGTDINACCRSNDMKLVASGDDFGEVKLFRFPCVRLKSDSHVGVGHSSHVTNVRFLSNDAGLISVGGNDCAIMQWKLISATTE